LDLTDSSLDRIFVNPSVIYGFANHVSLWAGYALLGSFDRATPWEQRAWQGVQLEKHFGGVIVINRARLEERVFSNANEIGLRVRELLRAVVPVHDRRVWAVVFSDEVFFNLNSSSGAKPAGFDQNRAFAGISWTVNPHLRLEWGYTNNFVAQPDDKADRLNHIGSVVVNYVF
jgi:hypothetical protein